MIWHCCYRTKTFEVCGPRIYQSENKSSPLLPYSKCCECIRTRLKCICALCLLLIWHLMTANDLTTPPLPLLVQGRPQVSFARDSSERGEDLEGGQITSKGDGLLRSNLPLGDSLLRGAGYFVTGLRITVV